MTRSANRMKFSQRMQSLCSETRNGYTKITEVKDPLAMYNEFRGLVLADNKVALSTAFPDHKLSDLKKEALATTVESGEYNTENPGKFLD